MLHVYHSNRLEALFILLCTMREARPSGDPLAPETVLVANPGIGRWLNFQIADRVGIAANIDYVLPATYVWQLYRQCLDNVPERSAFERDALRLRVLGQLDAITTEDNDIWRPLQRYMSVGGGRVGREVQDTKRVQLASRIADVFDQYLVYRPTLLLDWERGSDATPGGDPAQRWQVALWRRLVASVDEPHRAALWQRFCSLADNGQLDPALLPAQLHLFNVGLLPPSTLDVLVRLARVDGAESDRVSLYFLNPAIDYWGDLIDMRRAARERLKLGSDSALLPDDQVGNPLLSSLGASGRTLMKLLGERSEWVHDEQFFLPAASDNLLSAVQADLLQPFDSNESDTVAVEHASDDHSIQLHQCYSPVREVQALHDRLLDRFNADDTLTPADVIVMVPDINAYAPVIEAVFGSIGADLESPDRTRFIPWSIADRALMETSKVVACVQRLFELPGFEFEATAVLGFAAEPAIARRFGFVESNLNTLSEWLREAGVRRTLAGDHSKLLTQPVATLNSWDFGLRRLLLGRAMPTGSGAVGEILPGTQVDGQQAQLLSQLLNLLQALHETGEQLGSARTTADWVDAINDMIARFLLPDEEEADALAQLRELLVDLDTTAVSAGHTSAMTHATFAEILRGTLAGAPRKNHRYLTGRVTFSSMVPLRSVPFRVVCMLGLNDSDFPRQRPSPGFDLMAQHREPGDRSVRDDDRYLFLEAILSARDELYLSWIYRNMSDNAEREPSVLVSELRDYLCKRHPHRPAHCVSHPLQPFSATLFDSTRPALHTFASEWAPPREDLPITPVTLNDTGSPVVAEPQISLEDFQRFWRNPSHWYCRHVLGITLWRDEHVPEDAEPFESHALSKYQWRDGLIALLLAQPDLQKSEAHDFVRRGGTLPQGGLGELTFNGVYDDARSMVQRIGEHQPVALPAIDIDISVNQQQLQGQLHRAVKWSDGSVGLLHHHASTLKGKNICALWLAHLLGCAAGKVSGFSLVVGNDSERIIAAIAADAALEKLQPWFEGFNIGQSRALPFFANTSTTLAGAVKGNAGSLWRGSRFAGRAESEDEAVQLLYDNIDGIPDNPEVLDWATRLLGDPEVAV